LGSAANNISPTDKWAWSTNAGWVNFSPANGGVTVATDHLEGYAWAENFGWLKLGSYTGGGNHTYGNTSATDYGVNIDAAGNCSGYAWSSNVGWINFKPTNGGVTVNPTTGRFDGYAWSENVGWIHFHNASPAYTVQYIPTSTGTSNGTSSTPPLPDYLGLFLQIDGTGHGKVTTDTGLSGQSSDCQVDIKSGDLKCNPQARTQLEKTASYVTLTPQADSDSVFSSWGGNEDCINGQVFMNGGKLCIAYFHRIYDLTVTLQGQGQVTSLDNDQPAVIDCGLTCQAAFSSRMRRSLQATPATGMTFGGWGGDCEGTQNPRPVTVTKDLTGQARFLSEVVPAVSTTVPEVPATPPTITPETVVPTVPAEASTPVVPAATAEVSTPVVPSIPAEASTPVVPAATAEVSTPVVPSIPAGASTPVEMVSPSVVETPPVTPTPVPVIPITALILGGASSSCETTGTINQVCNYGGRLVTELDIQTQGMVSNGVLSSTMVNIGWISNFTITIKGKLTGGVVTGYIKNFGVMLDFDFKGMSIIGGTRGGTIRNTSKVGGYFQDVTLLAGTKITGGSLKGTIKGDKKSPAVLENVRVKKGSKWSGVKLGKNVKLEKGVVVEQ